MDLAPPTGAETGTSHSGCARSSVKAEETLRKNGWKSAAARSAARRALLLACTCCCKEKSLSIASGAPRAASSPRIEARRARGCRAESSSHAHAPRGLLRCAVSADAPVLPSCSVCSTFSAVCGGYVLACSVRNVRATPQSRLRQPRASLVPIQTSTTRSCSPPSTTSAHSRLSASSHRRGEPRRSQLPSHSAEKHPTLHVPPWLSRKCPSPLRPSLLPRSEARPLLPRFASQVPWPRRRCVPESLQGSLWRRAVGPRREGEKSDTDTMNTHAPAHALLSALSPAV